MQLQCVCVRMCLYRTRMYVPLMYLSPTDTYKVLSQDGCIIILKEFHS